MNILTESELRELWNNGKGKLPLLPAGTKFSTSAQDFLKSQNIHPEFSQNPSPEVKVENLSTSSDSWNKPVSFPIVLNGDIPVCIDCGQTLQTKPEHMTQIDAGHYAPKNSPRLILRGKFDSLHAMMLLTSSIAKRFGQTNLSTQLDTLSAYCRDLLSAEYNHRPAAALSMMGISEDQIHEISHSPEKYLGIPHILPDSQDLELLLWFNLLRTQCRELEIIVLQAFPHISSSTCSCGAQTEAVGSSLLQSVNRLSSAVYVLELLLKKGTLENLAR